MIYGLDEAIKSGAKNAIEGFNFCMSAIVVGIDNLSKGLIDVQPLVGYYDKTQTECNYPVIYNIPFIFPTTSTSSMTMPISIGDGVLLVFSQTTNEMFLNGIKTAHTPDWNKWLSLDHAVAFIGFSTKQESCFNPNNFNNQLNMGDVNLVHNRKSDNEVVISLTQDGKVKVIAPIEVNVTSPTVDCGDALVKTQGDVEVKGLSVYKHMTEHDHNYTDDGSPMITEKPNNK